VQRLSALTPLTWIELSFAMRDCKARAKRKWLKTNALRDFEIYEASAIHEIS
jgi:hypothetical protein